MKERKHSFTDKAPVVVAIIYGILALIITQVTLYALSFIFNLIVPSLKTSQQPFFTLILGVIALLIFKLWYKPEFTGFLKPGKYNKVWIVIVGYFIYVLFPIMEAVINHSTFKVTYAIFSTSLAAGVLEEIAFRAYMVPVLMRGKKHMYVAVFVPTIVFAFTHLFNIIAGADPLRTLFQVCTSLCMGIVFAALYIMSGNIILPMAIHFIHDIIAIGIQGNTNESGIITSGLTLYGVLWDIPLFILAIFVVWFMFNRKNKEEIEKFWDTKWSR